MSLLRTVGKGVAWTTAAAAIGKVLVIVNLFLILSSLSVYEYGLSELVMSVIAMMSIMLLPGLGTAVIADMSGEKALGQKGDARSILGQYFILSTLCGLAAWAVLFFGADIAAGLVGNVAIATFLKIVSFLFLLSPLRMVTTIAATVERRFADQSFFGVMEEFAKMVAILYFLIYLGKTIDGLLYAVVLGQACAIVIFLPRTLSASRNLQGGGRFYAFWEILLQHRKWSIASTYVSNLTQTTQIWLIRLFLGTEAVGLYSVAAGVLSQVSTLLPLGSILAPIIPAYIQTKDKVKRLVVAALKVQSVFAVSLYVLAIGLLPVFVIIFPKYEPAAWLVPILLLSLLPMSFLNITSPVFAALKEQRSYVMSALVKLGFTVLCFPIGMVLFGLPGLAIANVIVLIVSAYERWRRLGRISPELKIHRPDIVGLTTEEKQYMVRFVEALYSRAGFTAFRK